MSKTTMVKKTGLRAWSRARAGIAGLTAIAALAGTAQAQDYGFVSQPLGFTSIDPATGGGGTDITSMLNAEGLATISIPFAFEFFGQMKPSGTMVVVSDQHFLTFDTTFSVNTSNNVTIPSTSTTSPNEAMYVFWDAFNTGGVIVTQLAGTAGSQTFTIEWKGYPSTAGGSADCQIVLFEGTNVIEFRYLSTSNVGSNLWTGGLENATGTLARGTRISSASGNPAENVRFTPISGAPDLTINTLILNSTPPVLVGDNIDVDVIVENVGTANSTMFDVNVYLSVDNIIDPATDLLLGSYASQFQVDAGLTQGMTVNLTISQLPNPPASGRAYFVGVFADPTNTQMDLDPTNNSDSRGLNIGPDAYTTLSVAQGPFSSIIGATGTTLLASSAQSLNTGDDGEVATMTPFAFPYFGATVASGTPVAVGRNGYVSLAEPNPNTTSGFSNQPLGGRTATTPNAGILCPFWDDLNVPTTGPSAIAERVTGTSPNRVWTIEFNQLTRFSSTVVGYTAQVVIEEGGIIRFNYDPNLAWAGTASASIGLEDLTGQDQVEVMGTPGISVRPNNNFIFVPQGAQTGDVDLSVSNLSGSPSTVNAAASLSLTRTLMNGGADMAGAFQVSYFLSADNMLDASDPFIGSEMVSSLGAGASMTMSTSVSIPTATAPGMYFLAATVNTGASPVIETDFGNNSVVSVGQITVVAPGKAQGDLNGDAGVDVADIMVCINNALSVDPTDAGVVATADLNADNIVDVLDVQLSINLVLNAP